MKSQVKVLDAALQEFKLKLDERVVKERADAVKKSRSVIKGQINENLAPYLPGFHWNAANVKFLGQPIDMIIFEGMDQGEITEIIIVDVKTGVAQLNKSQRQIRDCLRNGKVSFQTWRPDSSVKKVL